MDRQIKELIVHKLQETLPVCHINDDRTEYTVRCPYCGDSKKDLTHAHMGIHIDLNQDDAMIYNCFKCGASGILTDDTLSDLGIYLAESEVQEFKRYAKKVAKISNRTIIKTENYRVPVCTPDRDTERKRMYLCNRVELNFDYETMAKCKIIPSLQQFLIANELKGIPGVDQKLLYQLDRYYIGFLSSNNNLLTLRNLGDKGRRYWKVFINPLNADANTFYSIPAQLDLMYEGDLHVHIAEGTFDIVSIKFNVQPNYPNQIFYASCGYSYLSILKSLVRSGINTHLNLHIYADADKSDETHWETLHQNQIYAFAEHVYLHRNATPGEKDYGVPARLIHDTARKLW